MSTHPPAKRRASNVEQSNYLGHATLPNHSDAYALATATQHLRYPALDSTKIGELQIALDPHYVFQDHEQSIQVLYGPQTIPYSACSPEYATTTVPHEIFSWDTLFYHPQPFKPYSDLTTRIDKHTYEKAHLTASSPTLSDEENPYPTKSPSSPVQKRRFTHIKAEPSTTRATSLRKNRDAASKCRNKQKKEQDDLIKAARDAEQRNKVMKAKLAILNDDLGELMLLVEQHYQCPDSRLRLYVERIGRMDLQNMG